MARSADDIVRDIRARRGQVIASVNDLLSTHELARRIRRHPWAWLTGGAVAGAAAGGFFPRTVMSQARSSVMSFVTPKLKTAVLGILAAAFARAQGDESLRASSVGNGEDAA